MIYARKCHLLIRMHLDRHMTHDTSAVGWTKDPANVTNKGPSTNSCVNRTVWILISIGNVSSICLWLAMIEMKFLYTYYPHYSSQEKQDIPWLQTLATMTRSVTAWWWKVKMSTTNEFLQEQENGNWHPDPDSNLDDLRDGLSHRFIQSCPIHTIPGCQEKPTLTGQLWSTVIANWTNSIDSNPLLL